MTAPARIEALRRRVHLDPASIAFAELAEAYRPSTKLVHALETLLRAIPTARPGGRPLS